MDEPWNHAKWRKPHTKGHILHNSIYMKYPEGINPQSQKQISGWQGLGHGGNGVWLKVVSLLGDDDVLEDFDDCTLWMYFKIVTKVCSVTFILAKKRNVKSRAYLTNLTHHMLGQQARCMLPFGETFPSKRGSVHVPTSSYNIQQAVKSLLPQRKVNVGEEKCADPTLFPFWNHTV